MWCQEKNSKLALLLKPCDLENGVLLCHSSYPTLGKNVKRRYAQSVSIFYGFTYVLGSLLDLPFQQLLQGGWS